MKYVIPFIFSCFFLSTKRYLFAPLSWEFLRTYLNNYFNFYVCLSIRPSVCPCVLKQHPISTVLSKNVIVKSCLVCIKNEKYVFWVTLRLIGSMRQGKAKLHTLYLRWSFSRAAYTMILGKNCKLLIHTLEFHNLPRVSPKQLCVLAHLGCTRAVGTF